jgi:G:T-mismatch repair DNA endonuclease (very short patch repair protein)
MRDTGEYKQYSNCCIEFYLKKGLSIEEAKKELKKRQSTNTLETYTKKYGEEQGYKKWSERNKKWSENIEQRYKNGEFTRDPNINGKLAFSSSSEHELCHELVQLLLKNNITKDKIYTQTVYNGQYHIFKHHKQYYYDFAFIDETHKKIIEYNGDFWHMNPNQYIKTDMNCVMNKTAQEIWDYDTQKSLVAQELGFDIFTVWESEYKNNKEQIINTCIKFLLNVDRI